MRQAKKLLKKICGVCNRPFETRWPKAMFCGRACSNVHISKTYSGKNNANWRGGYHKDREIYTRLISIRQRCSNPKFKQFKDYGGRGIKCLITASEIRELWERDGADFMTLPSIDRIDNDGHYEFSNCRFIEQSENSRRSAINRRKKEHTDGRQITDSTSR